MDELVEIDGNNNIVPVSFTPFEPIKENNRKRKIFLVSATLTKAFRGQ